VCYREMSPITPAGKPEPIEIWRAERAARVPPVDPRDGVPMVGRQAELCSLVDRVAGAVRDRTPAMVSVVGPAGIGKSRLVHEAAHTVQATEGPVRWWFGHCSPCHRGRYAPLAELVRNQAGVRDDDDAMTIRRRLAAWAGDLVDAADLPRTLAALAALLGLPAESPADTEHPDVARACLRVLLSAARNPLVIVLEDVQHADAAMIQFVRDLLSAAVAAPQPLPLAVVVTHRPEPHRPEPDSPVAADSDLTVVLQPLADRDATRLLRRLLDRTGQPAALADRLTPFASGNPGYAEEYVRSLAEHGAVDGCAGATEVVTPERVRGIVSALLDHLDEPDRAIVQAAAVLGDAVWPDAVAALLGADPAEVHDALRRLEHRGLLRHTATTTAGQTGYVFSQAAVRQVAYARLPRTVRLAYHRDAARWLSAGVARRHRSVDERVRHWLAASALAHLLRLDSRPFLAAASAALAVAARPTIGRDATVRTHAPGSRAYRQRPACRPAIPHRTTNRGPRRARAVVQGRGRSP